MTDDNMPDVQPSINAVEALALEVWNSAIEAAAALVDKIKCYDDVYGDDIRKLKK